MFHPLGCLGCAENGPVLVIVLVRASPGILGVMPWAADRENVL